MNLSFKMVPFQGTRQFSAGSLPQETDRHVILWVDLLDLNDPNPPISHPQNLEENTRNSKKRFQKNPLSNGNQIRPKNPWGATKQMLPFPPKNLGRPTWHPPETFSEADLGWAKTLGRLPKGVVSKTPSRKNLIEKSSSSKGPFKKRGILLGTRRVMAQISSSSWTWSLLAWLAYLVYGQVVYLWKPSLGWGQEKPSKAEKFLQDRTLNHQPLPYLEDYPI